ncbi:MAG TPA: serine hydroxymethyltransferase [Streptomyces sp.]|nr:serine hydroxymethyltransferase [Streptomyces sp.]
MTIIDTVDGASRGHQDDVARHLGRGYSTLGELDPELTGLMGRELNRQRETLSLVASGVPVPGSTAILSAMPCDNVTAEGYPGRRYHAGCEVIDEIEALAIDRAKQLFGATYVNVQPHSASSANLAVLASLLKPGERILGMRLREGGHLTHGSPASFSGRNFEPHSYGLGSDGLIDYDQVRRLALELRPRIIICGATAYSRAIDFARFREIADESGALLLADISHIAGLVATGLHQSPIDYADITTACTHKQLFGPRGGLIMSGKRSELSPDGGPQSLARVMQRTVFPFFQGAPHPAGMAAKARAFGAAATPEFRALCERIVELSGALVELLGDAGFPIVSRGSDNHIVLVDVASAGTTGAAAEAALEACGIITNKNLIPGDTNSPSVTSGLRLGTNALASRMFDRAGVEQVAAVMVTVLKAIAAAGGTTEASLPAEVVAQARESVAKISARYPLAI